MHAIAVQLPMDGFHLYKRQLDAMADPVAAHARRGAHWTFDAAAFVGAVKQVGGGGKSSCEPPGGSSLAESRAESSPNLPILSPRTSWALNAFLPL